MLQNATSWLEQSKQQGIQQGLLQGRQEGRQEGEMLVLRRLLHRRFGFLPGWAQTSLEQGEQAQLEEWADRVLDAKSLEEVFEE